MSKTKGSRLLFNIVIVLSINHTVGIHQFSCYGTQIVIHVHRLLVTFEILELVFLWSFEMIKIHDLCPSLGWWSSLFFYKKVYLWSLKWNLTQHNDPSHITNFRLHKPVCYNDKESFWLRLLGEVHWITVYGMVHDTILLIVLRYFINMHVGNF